MAIQLTAKASCNHCGATAACTLDGESLSRDPLQWGEAVRGLAAWFYKTQHNDLACSEACKNELAKDQRSAGRWMNCKP